MTGPGSTLRAPEGVEWAPVYPCADSFSWAVSICRAHVKESGDVGTCSKATPNGLNGSHLLLFR